MVSGPSCGEKDDLVPEFRYEDRKKKLTFFLFGEPLNRLLKTLETSRPASSLLMNPDLIDPKGFTQFLVFESINRPLGENSSFNVFFFEPNRNREKMGPKDELEMSNDKNHDENPTDTNGSLTRQFDLDANLLHLGLSHCGYFPLGIYSIALFLVFMCPAQYMTGTVKEKKNGLGKGTAVSVYI